MNIVCENWLLNTINEVKSLQYDRYLQPRLLMFMMTSFANFLKLDTVSGHKVEKTI